MRVHIKGRAALILIVTVIAAMLLGAACSSDSPSVSSQPSPIPVEDAADAGHEADESDEGLELFVAKGCSACHGDSAQGTVIAPALPGHSATAVKRQVRAPIGLMPVFPPDKVSNAELEVLAQWVDDLPGAHAHMRPADAGAAVANHHWMALFALEEDNLTEVRHHVDHILGLVVGDHLNRMEKIREDLVGDEVHESIHAIQEMLVAADGEELTERDMHLKLALSAARIEDADEAVHHIEHLMVLSPESGETRAVLSLLREGELAEAEHALEALLGGGHDEPGHDDADEHAGSEADEPGHDDADEHAD
jgi:mono/diheme cytochrome c family protein